MSKFLQPANDMVLVSDLSRETTIDGIILPDNIRQQEMVFGTVVAKGAATSTNTQERDVICYGPYAGKTVVIEGIEFRLLREGQIEAYVREREEKHE